MTITVSQNIVRSMPTPARIPGTTRHLQYASFANSTDCLKNARRKYSLWRNNHRFGNQKASIVIPSRIRTHADRSVKPSDREGFFHMQTASVYQKKWFDTPQNGLGVSSRIRGLRGPRKRPFDTPMRTAVPCRQRFQTPSLVPESSSYLASRPWQSPFDPRS